MSEEIKINGTKISIVKDDLTMMDVKALVFYAKKDLNLGSGYGNAISTRGGPSIKKELEEMDKPDVTEAVVSKAGNLKAEYIIHAVGPVFQEENIKNKLERTLENTLKTADKNKIKDIAFPIMGAGFYGVPPKDAIKIMFETTKKYLSNATSIEKITFCGNDNREYRLLMSEIEILK